MIEYDELPDDLEGMAGFDVSFPRLPADTASSCPVPMKKILDYLAVEVPDGDVLETADLRFVRTARVADSDYWIWRFTEPDGDEAYVTVSRDSEGVTCVTYDTNDYGLTPEQFVLAAYHRLL